MNEREQLERLESTLLGFRFALLVNSVLPGIPAAWLWIYMWDDPAFVPGFMACLVLSATLIAGAIQGLRARHDPNHLIPLLRSQRLTWWTAAIASLYGGVVGATLVVQTFAQF